MLESSSKPRELGFFNSLLACQHRILPLLTGIKVSQGAADTDVSSSRSWILVYPLVYGTGQHFDYWRRGRRLRRRRSSLPILAGCVFSRAISQIRDGHQYTQSRGHSLRTLLSDQFVEGPAVCRRKSPHKRIL